MLTIALTGGIGCGKSEAANIFAELGVPIIDLDVISHQLSAPNQPLVAEIAKQFGQEYITPEGALNRSAMRKLVFNNEAERQKLNAITHPAIFEVAKQQLQSNLTAPYQILAIPLLYEGTHYIPYIDQVLMIDCDEAKQIKRVSQRNHLSEAEVKQVIAAQSSRQNLLSIADDVIENNDSVSDLHQKIRLQHQKYIKTCIVSKTIT